MAVPYCQRLEGKLVILGDNLASHFSEEVLKKCTDFNISFICLPPNSTHRCQPLDVSVAPLKRYWRDVLTNWKKTDNRLNTTLPKEWFPRLLKQLLNRLKPTIDVGYIPLTKIVLLIGSGIHTQPIDDSKVRDAVSVAFLDHLSDIQHGAPKRVQRKKRLNVTQGKSVSSADYKNNIDDSQPTTSGVNCIVPGAPTSTCKPQRGQCCQYRQ